MGERLLFDPEKRSVEITVMIPQEMFEQLKEIHELYGLSYSEFIRNAIVEKLSKIKSSC